MSGDWPLTGRAEELAAVLSHTGAGGVVLAGAAGVGKSRLAREALLQARRNGRPTRYVTATSSAQSVPLGAFADYATRLGDDPLARVGEVIAAVTDSDGGRLLLMIDDAHLLDEQSALVVLQIARRGLATLVLTIRSGEPAPDAVIAVWKERMLPRLDVQPLSCVETTALLESVLDGPVDTASAERLWHYTRGNVLYLRQLLADELASRHIARRAGIWIWDAEPAVSPTLAELIDANIGRQSERVLDVLDVLAVAEPLELDVLRAVVGDDGIDVAEAANLITVLSDSAQPVVQLAHPMYGEVRRLHAPALRLRRWRSAVLTASPPIDDRTDLVRLVRQGVLLVDSDTAPDPGQLIAAASAALKLLDPLTAERLARQAVHHGGGRRAEWWLMDALGNGDRLDEALAINAHLVETAATTVEQVRLTVVRVGILFRKWAIHDARQQLESIADLVHDAGFERPYNCNFALVLAYEGDTQAALETAVAGLEGTGQLTEAAEFTGILALATVGSQLGRIDLIRAHIDRGYQIARNSAHVPSGRFTLPSAHVEALQLAGYLAEAAEIADRMGNEPIEFPFASTYGALIRGGSAMCRGNLAASRRLFSEAAAAAEHTEMTWIRTSVDFMMATAWAMSGKAVEARDLVAPLLPLDPFTQRFEFADTTQAWVAAVEGRVTEAAAIMVNAAERACTANRPTRELWCLQIATQFGDASGAERLAELTELIEGPRVVAAAAHAAALRLSDGDGLLAAARSYEAFGDRIAAGDAAAQAAVVFRNRGQRGAAMTATAFAQRLADATGADTPALRANNSRLPLTRRQREVIALAATGLSNRQIAERLTMSVRTVEGHLFRASQLTGVNRREELIALLTGK